MLRRFAAVAVAGAAALIFAVAACARGSRSGLETARSSADTIVEQLEAADEEVGKLDSVDSSAEDASANVAAARAAAASRNAAARKELDALRSTVDGAPDGRIKSQWQDIVTELDGLLAAHTALATARLDYEQAVAAVVLQREIPATQSDLALAFGMAAAETPEGIPLLLKNTRQNFEISMRLALEADRLEPEADLAA